MPAPTIRYYESLGSMRRPARSAAGYRRYSDDAVQDLTFVREAQALGFSLEEIAEILKLSRSGKTPCERVLSIAHHIWPLSRSVSASCRVFAVSLRPNSRNGMATPAQPVKVCARLSLWRTFEHSGGSAYQGPARPLRDRPKEAIV